MPCSWITASQGRLSFSTDAFLGSGHMLEVYGDKGTFVLQQSSSDYAAGFRAQRGDTGFRRVSSRSR